MCHWQLLFRLFRHLFRRIILLWPAIFGGKSLFIHNSIVWHFRIIYVYHLLTYLRLNAQRILKKERSEASEAKTCVKSNEFLEAKEFGNNLHTNAVINTKVSLNYYR